MLNNCTRLFHGKIVLSRVYKHLNSNIVENILQLEKCHVQVCKHLFLYVSCTSPRECLCDSLILYVEGRWENES